MRRRFGMAVLLCMACAASQAETHVIVIENMRFSPQSLTVSAGDRIVWENKDLFPHTASANDREFDSGNIASQASWTYVAGSPGEYRYHCAYHPTMTATLTVR